MKSKRTILFIGIFLLLFATCLTVLGNWLEKKYGNRKDLEGSDGSVVQAIKSKYPCIPSPHDHQNGIVTHVIDGDSIRVKVDGREYELRYIGIDAPEMVGENPFAGRESKAANQVLVDGREVLLFRDFSETDRYGRLLRYVFVGTEFINYRLVQEGQAIAKSYPPDIACQDVLYSVGK
jgi:endonuclease YncB( thermonuclease family)